MFFHPPPHPPRLPPPGSFALPRLRSAPVLSLRPGFALPRFFFALPRFLRSAPVFLRSAPVRCSAPVFLRSAPASLRPGFALPRFVAAASLPQTKNPANHRFTGCAFSDLVENTRFYLVFSIFLLAEYQYFTLSFLSGLCNFCPESVPGKNF